MTNIDALDVTSTTGEAAVLKKLSGLDRFLPVWIIAATAVGLLLGTIGRRPGAGSSTRPPCC